MKTRGSHRVYRRRDVELAVLIRKLLHEEGYTVPGARKRIQELVAKDRQEDAVVEPTRQSALAETNLRADLLAIREELQYLLNHLTQAETEHPPLVASRSTAPAQGTVAARPSSRSTHG